MKRGLPLSHMLTEEYQRRLKELSKALCGEPVREMWLSGGGRDGWWLSGQRGGDFKLPNTKGYTRWEQALEAVEQWVTSTIGKET